MRRRKGPLWWLGRTLVAILLLALAVIAYGSFATARELAQHPPPGRLVDVGGHRLHLNCIGEGSPTALLESGGGGWSLDWSLVQPQVSTFTRTCSYDRAGFGWSEPGPLPRDARQAVSELHALLEHSGEVGPYILVGHSLGGHFVRLYASQYSSEVAAMILLDARHERFDQMVPEYRQASSSQLDMVRMLAWMARLGILHVLGPLFGPPTFLDKFPSEVVPTYLSVGFQAKFFDTILHENEAIENSDAQVRDVGAPGGVPLVVVVRGLPDAPATLAPAIIERGEALHRQLQAELVRGSSNGSLVVAEGSGHGIMLDQPQLVIDIIRGLLDAPR